MTNSEIKNIFSDKLNSCYPAIDKKYKNIIYWFYDESYIRKIKLCKINNQDVSSPSKVNGICLFKQDIKTKRLNFDCDFFCLFLKENFNITYGKKTYQTSFMAINTFIKSIDKFEDYICSSCEFIDISNLDNLEVLNHKKSYLYKYYERLFLKKYNNLNEL